MSTLVNSSLVLVGLQKPAWHNPWLNTKNPCSGGGSTGFLFLRTSSIHRNNPSSKHLPAVVVWQHCFSIKERNYKSPAACIEKLYQLLFWTQSSLQPSVLFLASVWIINGKGFSSFNIWPHWTQARWMCVCVSIRISLLCFDVFHWGPIPPVRAGWAETADVVPILHLSSSILQCGHCAIKHLCQYVSIIRWAVAAKHIVESSQVCSLWMCAWSGRTARGACARHNGLEESRPINFYPPVDPAGDKFDAT